MIRNATPADVPAIAGLIRELAEYEKLSHAVDLEESLLAEHLFGPRPCSEVLIAEDSAAIVVGFALFFQNYSTFRSKPGLYLEDLFVKPAHRGQGHGKALFSAVAAKARERGCARFEWAVLDWNRPAIDFYESMGAIPLHDWTVYRLTGDALTTIAETLP
ncbi:GNAT family N-acetyltransferase [soil metagenome]